MKAISFGKSQNLIGILREPDGSKSEVIAILWNTGICTRIGPNRFNVEIAEALANQGIASFRFDLGQLGDSLNQSDEVKFIERNQNDLKAAFDQLEAEYGYQKFLLIGICSSAIDAFHAAVRDTRVQGLVMVDTFAYATPRFKRSYVSERLFKTMSWKRLMSRKAKEWTGEWEKTRAEAEAGDNFEGEWPEQVDAEKGLGELIDRKIPMFVAYTGGFQHVYGYETQFLEMFPNLEFNDTLSLSFHPKADHLFTLLEDRQLFLDSLRKWTKQNFANISTANTPQRRSLQDVLREIESFEAARVALEFHAKSMTYGELTSQARNLAGYLQSQTEENESLIGLCLDRSFELISSILGILKAGKTYLPLDPHYPSERLETMIQIARCKTVLCHRRHADIYRNLGLKVFIWEDIASELAVKTFPLNAVHSEIHSPAYVIFTSGSTGTPKGVVLGHGALTELLDWHKERYPAEHPKTVQFTPISFDVSFQEILSCLHLGGTLTLIEEELRLDPIALLELMIEAKTERIFLPFVALQFLSEAAVTLKL